MVRRTFDLIRINKYLLFLFFLVYSRSIHKLHFFDVIHKTINKDTDTILLEVRPHKFVHSTTITSTVTTTITSTTTTEQSQSTANTQLKARESWDSEEDHYFKWAAQNRRPMESLAGRKRTIEQLLKLLQKESAIQSTKLIE